MNKEIELVEDAVNSVSFAIKQYQQELRELKLSSQEKKLKDLLENVPQAVYHKTETDCYACVDGVTLDIEDNDCFYGFRAKHKMLIKLFNFGWVINKTTFFSTIVKASSLICKWCWSNILRRLNGKTRQKTL